MQNKLLLTALIMLFSIASFGQNLSITSSGQTGTSGTNWTSSESGGVFTLTATGDATVNSSVITDKLNAGTDVIVVSKDININTSIVASSNSSEVTLTFKASRQNFQSSSTDIKSNSNPLNVFFYADTNNDADGINMINGNISDTNGGYIKFGNGTTKSIGGVTTYTGGDIYLNGSSAQSFSSESGAIDVYGEIILANSNGLTINSNGGAITFRGKVDSGNTYTSVNTSLDWSNAVTNAKSGTGSSSGDTYLATITTRLENAIASKTVNYNSAWIGARRVTGIGTNYTWRWVTGPEGLEDSGNGLAFFTQDSDMVGGTAINGYFQNWNPNEPNNYNGSSISDESESALQFTGTEGKWNDLPKATTTLSYYVKETNAVPSPVSIDAGSAALIIEGSIGSSKELSSLTVTATSTTINGSVVTSGAQSFSSSLTVSSTNSNISIEGTSTDVGGAFEVRGADVTLDSDITADGSIATYGTNIYLNDGADITVTTSDVLGIYADGNFTTDGTTRRTLQTANGNINLYIDADANASGTANIDYLTIDSGTATTTFRSEMFSWTTTSDSTKPYFNGTGNVIIESSDSNLGQYFDTLWVVFDQDNDGMGSLRIGKTTNSQNITLSNSISSTGSINLYGLNVTISDAVDVSSGGADGDVLITATGAFSGSGNITLGSSGSLTVSQANAGTFSGIISGSSATLTKEGAGTLTLTGANTYSGNTTISAGGLTIGGSGSLGSGTYTGALANTYAANISNSGTFTFSSSSDQVLSGIISGSGPLLKNTDSYSTLMLSGANTYTGATTVSTGFLTLGATNALPSGSNLTLNGTLNMNGYSTEIGTLTGSGVITNEINVSQIGLYLNYDFANDRTYSGSGTTITNLGSGGDASLTGSPTYSDGAFNFTDGNFASVTGFDATGITTNGFTILSKTDLGSANSWERIVDFGNGSKSQNLILARSGTTNTLKFEIYNTTPIVAVGADNAITSGKHVYTVSLNSDGDVALYRDGGTALATATGQSMPVDTSLTKAYIGESNWSADLQNIVMDNLLFYTKGLSSTEVSAVTTELGRTISATTLTVNTSATSTFSGTINQAKNNISLVKAGSEQLTLSGANTYSGTTTIESGKLKLGNASAISSGSVIVDDGAALDIAGYGLSNVLSLSGSGVSSSGSLYNSTSTNVTVSGATTLAADTTIKSESGGTLTYSGSINGAHALTIDTDGTSDSALTLSGIIGGSTAPTSLTSLSGSSNTNLSAAITVAGAVSITGGQISSTSNITIATASDATVLMKATDKIESSGVISSTLGKANVVMWADSDDSGAGSVYLSGAIKTNGGGVWLGGSYLDDGNTTGGSSTWQPYEGASSITVGDGYAKGVTGRYYGVESVDIITAGGNVNIKGEGAGTSNNQWVSGYYNSGGTISTGVGNITIDGKVADDYTATSNTFGRAVQLRGDALISSTNGNITITGTVTNTHSGSYNGIFIYDAVIKTAPTDSTKGNIILSGTASGTNADSGIEFYAGSTTNKVVSNGDGDITITGNSIENSANGIDGKVTIGYDGVNAYTGNTTFNGDRIDFSQISLAGSGSLEVTPIDTSFESTLTFDLTSLGSTFNNVTLGSTSNTADVSIVDSISAAGPITVYGGDITPSANLTSSAANSDIKLLASNDITNSSAVTITTGTSTITGGNVLLSSDRDGSGGGQIYFGGALEINSNGGNITLAGGDVNGGGFAQANSSGSSYIGIDLATNINFNSSGGNITLRGKSLASTTTTSWRAHGILFRNATVSMNSGSGTLFLHGINLHTHSSDAGAHAIEGNAANTYTFISSNTTSSAIQMIGDANTAYQGRGINFEGVTSIQSLGENGGIQLTGYNSSNRTWAIHLKSGSSILSRSGTITVTGNLSDDGLYGYLDLDTTTLGSKASSSVTSSTADIVLKSNYHYNGNGNNATINTAGTLTLLPTSSSFLEGYALISRYNYNSNGQEISGLTVGSSTNTSTVNVNKSVTVNGPITVYGGDISISNTITATNSTISLHGTGSVSQTAAINTSSLALYGGADFTLTNSSNQIATLAGGESSNKLGNVSVTDASGGLEIGSVNPTGIYSTGEVDIRTLSGNLTISEDVITTSTSSDAIVIMADSDESAGTVGDGNIIVSGTPTLTVGSGGTVKMYSGSDTSSTGLTDLVSSSNVIYNRDSSSDVSSLSAGKYVLFRKSNTPTTTISLSKSTFYEGDLNVVATATSSSTGAITYSSSNTSAATIDSSTGSITYVGPGTTIITASVAANNTYTSNTATATLTTAKSEVSDLYTDLNGFWDLSSSGIKTNVIDHNVIGFEYNGVKYSTGVDDTALTSNGISFTAASYRALPINQIQYAAGNTTLFQTFPGFLDGNNLSTSKTYYENTLGINVTNPSYSDLADYLTEGEQGLGMRGLANIPSNEPLEFSINSIDPSYINDAIPDLLITTIANPATNTKDYVYLIDSSGNQVSGTTTVTIIFSNENILAYYESDRFRMNGDATSQGHLKIQAKAIRLSDLGVTTSNYSSVDKVVVHLASGDSDPAFVAYYQPSLSISSDLAISQDASQYQYDVTVSPTITVQIKDDDGANVNQSGFLITASILSGSATMTGQTTATTNSSGAASFDSLKLQGTEDVVLKFTASGLNTVTSTLSFAKKNPTISFSDITKEYLDADFNISATSSSTGSFTYSSSNTSIATVSGTTVSVVDVGSTILTATQASDTIYSSYTATATLTVEKRTPSYTVTNVTASYGANDIIISSDQINLNNSEQEIYNLVASSTDTNVATIATSGSGIYRQNTIQFQNVGSSTISLTHVASTRYKAGTVTLSVTVNKATPSFNPEPVAYLYGETNENGSISLSTPNGELITEVVFASYGTPTGSAGDYTQGSCHASNSVAKVEAVALGNSSFTINATNGVFGDPCNGTAKKLYLKVKYVREGATLEDVTKNYGDDDFVKVGQTASDGAMTFSSSDDTVVSITSTSTVGLSTSATHQINKAGTAVITVSQAATSNYNAATTSYTVTVGKANPTISIADIQKTYGESDFNLSATSSSTGTFSYTSNDSSIATVSGTTVTLTGVGSTTISVSQASVTNYNAATTSLVLTVLENIPNITTQPSTANQYLQPNATATSLSVAVDNSVAVDYQWYKNTTSSNSGGTIISGATSSTYTPVTSAEGDLYYYVVLTGSSSVTSSVSGRIRVQPDELQVSYHFDNADSYGGSGTVLTDVSGNELDATIVGGVSFSSSALTLDGSANYIQTPQIPYTGTSGQSFSIVAKVTPLGSSGNIVNMSNSSSNGGWNMPPIGSAGNVMYAEIYSNNDLPYTYTTGQTYTLTLVWDATNSTQKFYVDGNLVGSQSSISYSASGSNNYFFLGKSNPGCCHTYSTGNSLDWYGKYHTFEVYSKALNSTEVVEILNIEDPTITFNALTAAYGDDPITLTATSNSSGAITYSSSDTSIATISGTTMTIQAVGSAVITASQVSSTNYNSATATTTLTVSKGDLSLTFADISKTYNDTDFSINATSSGTGAITYSSSDTSVATISGTTVTIIGGGSAVITASQVSDTNYNSATATASLTVAKDNPVLSGLSSMSKTYNDADFNISATSSSTGAITYSSSDTSVATISGTTVTIVGAGSAVITASQVADTNYNSATVTASLTVAKDNPVLSGLSAMSKTYNDADFSISATSSSTGAITFSSSDTSVATISGTTVTIAGAGSTVITASQAADANYNSATLTATLTVAKGEGVSLVFDAVNKTFGDADFKLKITSSTPIYSPLINPSGAYWSSSSVWANDSFYADADNYISGTGHVDGYHFTPWIDSPQAWSALTNDTNQYLIIGLTQQQWIYGIQTQGRYNADQWVTSAMVQYSNDGSNWTTIEENVALNTDRSSKVNIVFDTPIQARYIKMIPLTWSGHISMRVGLLNDKQSLSYSSADTSVISIVNNTASIQGAGSVVITATQSETSNYIASTSTFTIDVAKATPILSGFNSISKTYNDADFSISATSSSTGAITYSSSDTSVATISGTTVTIVGAGSAVLTASQTSDANYNSATVTASLTVAKDNPVLSGLSAMSKTYNDADFSISATSSSTGAIIYSSSDTSVATISGTTVTIVSVGTTVITASQAADSNYNSATLTASLTVAKDNPVLSGLSSMNKTYNDADFSISATSSSTGAVTYSSSDTSVATISGTTVTIAGTGSTVITASQAADDNYNSATLTATLTVAKDNPVLSGLSAMSKTYNDVDFSISATSSSTGAITYSSSDTSVATISGTTVTIVGAGSAVITASQAADTNYNSATATASLTVAKDDPILTGLSAISKSYNDADFNISATSSSTGVITYSSSNTSVAAISGTTVTIVGAGSAVITALQATDSNYNSATATATLTVAKDDPVISGFNALTKTYLDSEFDLSASSNSSGAITYNSTDTSIATISGTTVTIVGAGTTSITLTQVADSNYNTIRETVLLTVQKAVPSLTTSDVTKTFASDDFVVDSTIVSSNSNGAFSYSSNNSSVATVNGSTIEIKGGGSALITVSQVATANFTTATASFTLTVAKIEPTIGFKDVSKTYGDADFNLSPTTNSTGAINYSSSDTNVATVSGTKVSIVGVGSTTITLDQAADTNYLAARTSMVLTVAKKQLTVSGITANTRIYDGTTIATIDTSNVIFSGIVSGDNITITSTGVFDTADVGDAKEVTLTSTYSGTVLANYSITDQETTTASITQKTVQLTGLTKVTKVYDASTMMPSNTLGYGSLAGLISGDMVSVVGSPKFDSAQAGERIVLQGTVAISGANASNYKLSWSNGSGTITKKTLYVIANNDAKFVTTTDDANFKGAIIAGFVPGESKSDLSGTLEVVRTNADIELADTYNGVLQPTGYTSNNYNIEYLNGTFTILPADHLLLEIEVPETTYSNTPQYAITGSYLSSTTSEVIYLNSPTFDEETQRYTIYDGVGGSASFGISAVSILGPSSRPQNIMSKSGNINAGTYQLAVSDVEIVSNNFNEDITTLGAITVIPKVITPYASGPTKDYDGTRTIKNTIIGLSGVVEGDDVKTTFTGLYDSKDAGTELGYLIDDIVLGGDDVISYALSTSSFRGTDGVINKIPLAVTGDSMTKVYDGQVNSTFTQSFNGFIEGEDQTDLSGTVVRVGEGTTATTIGTYSYTLSGYTSLNYSISYSGGSVIISKAAITVSGIKANNKVYDGTTTATVDTSSVIFDGLVAGELATATSTGTFTTAKVGTDITVVLRTSYTGTTLANYTITDQPSTKASITKAPLTVTVNPVTSAYLGVPYTNFSVSYDGFVNGETSAVLGGSLEFTGPGTSTATMGTHSVSVSGLISDNYEITYVEGSLTINDADTDLDGIGDSEDPDIDGDGILNEADVDINGDGINDNGSDINGDGINDANDTDIDGDGYSNTDDAFPLDASEWVDTDSDGIGNNADTDDDNDKQLDVDETACGSDPLDNTSLSLDTDGDHIPDCVDTDDDGDTVIDSEDAFPLIPEEWLDTDSDGIGNNTDTDDDNDGQLDVDELTCNSDPLNANELALDTDSDSIPNCVDTDDDNDGLSDVQEAELGTSPILVDTDNDGVKDQTEVEDQTDPLDACSLVVNHQTESAGIAAWEQSDCDGDGVHNIYEFTITTTAREINIYPLDTDGDGVYDYLDKDDDGDGLWTKYEFVDPNKDGNPNDAPDYDLDGIPDYLDNDDEGDGTPTIEEGADPNGDGNPEDAYDFDNDGIPNYLDGDDDNDGLSSEDELVYGTDLYDVDSDKDGVIDGTEVVDGTNPTDICSLVYEHQTEELSVWNQQDCDGDGVINGVEAGLDSDNDGILDYLDTDDDGDGLDTNLENASSNSDAAFDSDNDGIPNYLDSNNYTASSTVADDIEIYNAMSPNGDGYNDVFTIRNIEKYPDNELVIFNRWGKEIYRQKGYGTYSRFYNGVDINGQTLPVGTYYYVLRVNTGTKEESFKGFLYINR